MGLSLFATALSSINIPTGLLLVSSAVLQLLVFFSGFSALNLAGIQQSSRFLIGGRGFVVPAATGEWHLNAPLPRGDAQLHGTVSRCRRRPGVGAGSGEGAIAQQKLIT